MHVAFTSVNTNYLNRASLLAKSVKKNSPRVHFVLLLVEPKLVISMALQKRILENNPEFDEILTLEDFQQSVRSNLYHLPVVEACTAIKGEAMLHLLNRPQVDIATYLDPDLYFYQSLNLINVEHEQFDVLLTPHLLYPPVATSHILNDEIHGVAKHGVFNLGFISCRSTNQALQVVSWWADRLSEYCRVDYFEGLFTDQKWFDMAPAYFDCIGIVKHQGWNVAPWNFHERNIKGALNDQLFFIHFSKFPSNDFFTKVEISGNSINLKDLIDSYTKEFDRATIDMEPIKQIVANIEPIPSINPSPTIFNLVRSSGFIRVLEQNHLLIGLVNRGIIKREFAIRVRQKLRDLRKTKVVNPKLSSSPSFDVLILTHFGGGGVETIVQNEVLRLSREGNKQIAILRPNYFDKGYVLENSFEKFNIYEVADVHSLIEQALCIQLHHILGLESLLPKITEHSNVNIFLHDRYFLSTQPFRDALQFLKKKPNIRGVDWPLNSKVVEFDEEWRLSTIPVLKNAKKIYSPSFFIRDAYLDVVKSLDIEIINLDELCGYRKLGTPILVKPNILLKELRFVLIISPTGPHKGIDVIASVADYCADRDSNLRFRIYGSLSTEDLSKVDKRNNIEIVGHLPRHRLIYSLLETKYALGWIPSLTGESYSLALSDFLITDTPALVSSVGALTERAKENPTVFSYSPADSTENIAKWMMGRLKGSNFLLD